MKILHTADLHLGKKLNKASRLDEQCELIRELNTLADAEDIDVILIAGDVFDASVPPADAERVFYRSMRTLTMNGRAVIALAGNHDDERRLCAAKPLADGLGIVLAGELDYSGYSDGAFAETAPPPSILALADAVDYMQKQRISLRGHYGGVRIEKGAEKCDIALVPYPSENRLSRWYEQDYSLPYAERVKLALEKACAFFGDDSYKILCTHLFLSKSADADALGGLAALPVDVLPTSPDYVALGHVHKHYKVCKSPAAEYCGSPLQYAYDEGRTKSVNIVDTAKRTVAQRVISSGKKLLEADAASFDECMSKLDAHAAEYVRIRYGGEPLGKDEAAAIRSHPAYNDLVVVSTQNNRAATVRRAHLSDGELFELYYKHIRDRQPSAELKAAFIELLEAKHEAD